MSNAANGTTMQLDLHGLSVSDLHTVERPATRIKRAGPEALSDAELLQLALGLPSVPAKVPEGLVRASFSDLTAAGLTESRAAALVAAFELHRRHTSPGDARPVLDSPARVLDQIPAAVRAAHKEHLLAFYVNARSQLVHAETVSIGTLSASLVHPREVFAPAVQHHAAAVIVAHNHPSGDCTPSAEDKDATRRLTRAGELLGIPLLDHLVVAASGYFSFKDRGLLA